MNLVRRIYFKLFRHYRRLEVRCVSWSEGSQMLSRNAGKPPCDRWIIAKEEDTNRQLGVVWLERRERITS